MRRTLGAQHEGLVNHSAGPAAGSVAAAPGVRPALPTTAVQPPIPIRVPSQAHSPKLAHDDDADITAPTSTNRTSRSAVTGRRPRQLPAQGRTGENDCAATRRAERPNLVTTAAARRRRPTPATTAQAPAVPAKVAAVGRAATTMLGMADPGAVATTAAPMAEPSRGRTPNATPTKAVDRVSTRPAAVAARDEPSGCSSPRAPGRCRRQSDSGRCGCAPGLCCPPPPRRSWSPGSWPAPGAGQPAIAEQQAVHQVAELTDVFAESVVQPVLTDAMPTDAAATRSARPADPVRVLDSTLIRVKIWTPAGTSLLRRAPADRSHVPAGGRGP